MNEVIISCAVTGAVHTPSMSPHLPYTPEDIREQSLDAAAAGAAILHLHARDPETGRPSAWADVFMQFLPKIAQGCDAVINLTTGGGVTMTLEERLQGALRARPEMASLNMGTLNFSMFRLAERERDWRFDCEKPYLERTVDGIFRHTFGDIEKILKRLGGEHGTRFEFECYDLGHLYNLAHFVDRGLVEPPFFVQSVLGIMGGIGAHRDSVTAMKSTADRLFGRDYQWSLLAAGKAQMPLCTMAAILGGNVRVGLEDSLYLGRGELALSNAAQVAKIRRVLEELGFTILTPDRVRERLKLKGRQNVGF